MTPEERETLNQEWLELKEKTKDKFVDPKVMKRLDEITSLLMTYGESDSIKFNFLKGRSVTVGMNFKKPYCRKGGKVG